MHVKIIIIIHAFFTTKINVPVHPRQIPPHKTLAPQKGFINHGGFVQTVSLS